MTSNSNTIDIDYIKIVIGLGCLVIGLVLIDSWRIAIGMLLIFLGSRVDPIKNSKLD